MRILKSLLIWLCFIPVAILNGGFRQYVLDDLLGKGALPASGILLSLLILLVARWLLPRIGRLSRPERYTIGTLWATLTVLFEWTFAAMEGYTLPEWLAACNPLTGNLWVLSVPLRADNFPRALPHSAKSQTITSSPIPSCKHAPFPSNPLSPLPATQKGIPRF